MGGGGADLMISKVSSLTFQRKSRPLLYVYSLLVFLRLRDQWSYFQPCDSLSSLFIPLTSEGHRQGKGKPGKEDRPGQEIRDLESCPGLASWEGRRRREKPAKYFRCRSSRVHSSAITYGLSTMFDTIYAYQAPPVSLVLGFSSEKDRCDPYCGELECRRHWSDLLFKKNTGCLAQNGLQVLVSLIYT